MSEDFDSSIAKAAAIVHIQHLAIRYDVKVDQRYLPGVAAVYVDDVDCGHWGRGRDGLIRIYDENNTTMGVSMHSVTSHLVDIVDADNATGIVYLSAEHQQHDGTWAALSGAYHDTHERRDGTWLIAKRKLLSWYRDRCALSPGVNRDTSYRVFSKWPALPDVWPTWGAFWAEHEPLTAGHPSVTR